jgi:PAS domain S-box-containing protein
MIGAFRACSLSASGARRSAMGRSAASAGVSRTHAGRFVVITLIFVVVQVAVLGFGGAALRMINASRAYATGESLYSKAANAAVLNLYKYASSGDRADWRAFRSSLDLTLGDRSTREELDRPNPDVNIATEGFRRGGNNIEDIPDAIRVFRIFRGWGPFQAAVDDWSRGDETIDRLVTVGTELYAVAETASVDEPTRQRALHKIDELNTQLTRFETSFSTHIAEAARAATKLVTLVLWSVSLMLWSFAAGLAWRTYKKGTIAEIHLTESEARFRDFAEIASDWFWETGPDLSITFVSERFARATGISSENIVGRSGEIMGLNEILSEDRQDPAHKTFRGYIHRHVSADGEDQYWKIGGLPVYGVTGIFIGYRGTGSNVTEEVRAAYELRDAKNSSDLANRAKSEFLANVSHELRTPLNAILGFSEVIRDRVFGHSHEKYHEYARDIFTSGNLLLALIDDILDIAKIEAGRMELYEEVVDISWVIEEAVQLVRQKADIGRLQLMTSLGIDLPPIRADERKLKQIVLNLLSNSIKFTPGGGSISIVAGRNDAGDLAIQVTDTGIGIPAEKIARALEPFGQIANSFSRGHAGTGLGLPLAKSLVELHGGSFTLASELDRGTTVAITLPKKRITEPLSIHAAAGRPPLALSHH